MNDKVHRSTGSDIRTLLSSVLPSELNIWLTDVQENYQEVTLFNIIRMLTEWCCMWIVLIVYGKRLMVCVYARMYTGWAT